MVVPPGIGRTGTRPSAPQTAIALFGRLFGKVAKQWAAANRNSQSYARENIVSLNTTYFQ